MISIRYGDGRIFNRKADNDAKTLTWPQQDKQHKYIHKFRIENTYIRERRPRGWYEQKLNWNWKKKRHIYFREKIKIIT